METWSDVVSFPGFSDLEVIALGITAEALGLDIENHLFHRLHHECKKDLLTLITNTRYIETNNVLELVNRFRRIL